MRLTAILLTMLTLAACANTPVPSGPPGQASSSNVNPETGSRGGSGSGSSK
jgi:hypothetical protein